MQVQPGRFRKHVEKSGCGTLRLRVRDARLLIYRFGIVDIQEFYYALQNIMQIEIEIQVSPQSLVLPGSGRPVQGL